MNDLIFVECNGILDKEVILSALQEYRVQCMKAGNLARAIRVRSIITRINFKTPQL